MKSKRFFEIILHEKNKESKRNGLDLLDVLDQMQPNYIYFNITILK